MKNLTALILICLFFYGCSKEKSGNNENKETLVYKTSAECDKSRLQICNDGVPFAKIGDSLLGVKVNIPEITGIKDSTLETEDYTAFLRIVYFKEGTVVLEGTHFNKEDEKPELEKSHIDIIHITTPVFETPEKIKVGSSFADLRKVYPDSLFEVQPGAVSGTIELKIPKVSRLNYELSQEKNTGQTPGSESGDISDISPDAKIEAISLY
ncbi:MAG: hypothetical protein K1X92_15915 [Bacteroidia bacterium]|nr:hypothetical protein [Bacteroidia bacterium]